MYKTKALKQVNTFCQLFTFSIKLYSLFLVLVFLLPSFPGQWLKEMKEQKHSVFLSDNIGRPDVQKCSRPAHFYIW